MLSFKKGTSGCFFWFNNITPEDIKNVLVSIPGIFLGGFTFYFAYQKIGTKVLVSYEQEFSRITERRISSLELINEKNKTSWFYVCVFLTKFFFVPVPIEIGVKFIKVKI